MRKILLSAIISLYFSVSFAQVDMNFWDNTPYIHFGGGMVYPGSELKSTQPNGLYAKNGFQVFGDFNYIIKYGIGLGLNVEYDQFAFNKEAFITSSKPASQNIGNGYTSTKVGLNILMNIPIVVVKERFTVNMYCEFNPGIRGFNIPSIDLLYNENVNKYVEVHYRTRSNISGYIGYSAGLQLLFSERFGLNFSYNSVFRSRKSIKYSVRMFDAFGNLYEEERYLNNYLDHSGWQIGLMFLFGRK